MKTSPRLVASLLISIFSTFLTSAIFAQGGADVRIEAFAEREMKRFAEMKLAKGHVQVGELVLFRSTSFKPVIVKSLKGKDRAIVQFAPFDSVEAQREVKQADLLKAVKTSVGLVAGDVCDVKGFNQPMKVAYLFENGSIIVKNGEDHFIVNADEVTKVYNRVYTRGVEEGSVALLQGWLKSLTYVVIVHSVDAVTQEAQVSYIQDQGSNRFTTSLSKLYPESNGVRGGVAKGDEVSNGESQKVGRVEYIFDNGVVKMVRDNTSIYHSDYIWFVQK